MSKAKELKPIIRLAIANKGAESNSQFGRGVASLCLGVRSLGSLNAAAKDMKICMDLAKRTGLPMPGEENVLKVYDKALEMGLQKEDWGATVKAYRELAGEE